MSENQQEKADEIPRAAFYVDGFNLYHPLCELNKPHLKWVGLWALGERICEDRGHKLVSVTYCTAYQNGDAAKKERHKKYIEALEHFGVETVFGHYITVPLERCNSCIEAGEKQNEKQTDINLALSVFADAMNDKFDWAYLLSADSDQTATAKFLKTSFPDKKLVTVSPPLKEISTNIANHADGKRRLNEADIEKSRMQSIIFRDKLDPIRCPREYDIPSAPPRRL